MCSFVCADNVAPADDYVGDRDATLILITSFTLSLCAILLVIYVILGCLQWVTKRRIQGTTNTTSQCSNWSKTSRGVEWRIGGQIEAQVWYVVSGGDPS